MCIHGALPDDGGLEDGAWTFIYEVRSLFDFFDENAIFISVSTDGVCWEYDIYNPDGIGGIIDMWNNRTEAEEAAFEKAFEILEKRLP